MKTAVYPGSFDPVTYGHIDIIERAARLFDHLIVLVSINPMKPSTFSIEERTDFLRRSLKFRKNIEVDGNSGMLIDYLKEKDVNVIVKGLRAMSDFEYEFQMALINKDMYNSAETVFLSANAASMFLSSSAMKHIAMFGGDISAFVPDCIAGDITERLRMK